MVLLSLQGLSQNSKDSTLIPNSQLRLALQKVEQGRFCAEQLTLHIERNRLLESRIELKDSLIARYKMIDVASKAIIINYEIAENNLLQQKGVLASGVKVLEKQLRAQKRKTTFTSIAGMVGMTALALLFIAK